MKKWWLGLMVVLAIGWISAAGNASPPVGDQTADYYNGIWRVRVDEYCHRHEDGAGLDRPPSVLYMVLTWQDEARFFAADLYADLDGARTCDASKWIGDAALDFEFPGAADSYLIEGHSTVLVDEEGFTGSCDATVQGALRTAVRSSQIQVRSFLAGTNLAWCRSEDPNAAALACSGNWVARWIEILPDCGGLGANGGSTLSICGGDQVPEGYIYADDRWDPMSCGNPSTIVYNVWILKRYADSPVGSAMSVCNAAPTPPGWVKVSDAWNPQRCGHPTSVIRNVKTIKRVD